MNAMSFAAARRNLVGTLEKVCQNHDPVIITRSRGPAVVFISLEDYSSLEETAYLTRSPANARRLTESIAGLEREGRLAKRNRQYRKK